MTMHISEMHFRNEDMLCIFLVVVQLTVKGSMCMVGGASLSLGRGNAFSCHSGQ